VATPDNSNPLSGDKRVLVVTGGDPWTGPPPRVGAAVEEVIAADSGVELALQLGLPIGVVIGDLDSASPESLAEAERLGARIERHPEDKDLTDLELALDLACEHGAREIVLVGGGGGRTSHLLGNAELLGSDKYAQVAIRWLLPRTEVQIARPGRPITVTGRPEELVSLIPVGGGVAGITTAGLRWPLHEDMLAAGSTRGISNRLLAEIAEVTITGGTVLVVHERMEP
jgi:thiamine pyrophosphokinase